MSNQRTTDDTIKLILIVLAVIVLGPMLVMVFAFPMMGMWGGGRTGGFGVSPLWSIAMMLVWLVVLVGAGYLVYRWLSGSGSLAPDRALEELRVAYARGDITEEEYEQRQSKLDRE